MASVLVKKRCRCSTQESEEGPDASDILEGDYEHDSSTITSIIGMTDCMQEKAVYVERLKYVPNANEIDSVPPPPPLPPPETNKNIVDGAAIV